MASYTYTQQKKNFVRHQALSYAVTLLTSDRGNATCVNRSYVRDVYDFFTQTEDDSKNKVEASKINREYILDWEKLHDKCCGIKRPSDLVICYLCGPEPNNDFDEMISLGVLPQNIWAFEDDKRTYRQALSVYENESYKQPRIIRQNIETFFAQTPKKFDIIYIDACGSIPSDQHALRCISAIFQKHRLESPGIIISNFAEPDDYTPYIELLTQYFHAKMHPELPVDNATGSLDEETYQKLKDDISQNFNNYYSNFISLVLRDIPGIIVPLQRFWKNPYLNQIIKNRNGTPTTLFSTDTLQNTRDSLAKFFITYDCSNNPDFDQTDLFARLNSKPYPIKDNTFEMWNAYVDKDIVLRIRELANEYEGKIFKIKDTRMRVEELITSLAYLDYRVSQTDTELMHILNVYKKNDRLCSRIMSKETVTKTLSDISNKNPDIFLQSVNSVEAFAQKVDCLIDRNPLKLKLLFSHSRKGTQFKTDQNFYFLWAMLYGFTKDQVSNNKEIIFDSISKMFAKIQKSPDSYTPQLFFADMNTFPQILEQ